MSFFKDVNAIYRCDECKETFKAQEVKLKPAGTNVQIYTQYMKGVSKEGKIIGTHKFEDGDRTLHCPRCGKLHLFGFDKII